MANGKSLPRWLWEFLVLLLLAAIGYGGWWWLGIEHRAELQAQKDALVAESALAIAEMEQQVQTSSAAEATAAAVAFAAGIEQLAVDGAWQAIDHAALELLELPGVSFLHVLATDGSVRVSSDRKFLATGKVGPRGAWALQSDGVSQRLSADETIEIALPFGEGENRSVLWLGYSRQVLMAL